MRPIFPILIWLYLPFMIPVYAQAPVLTIPSGHSAWMTDYAVSTNGEYLVTASYDNTLKIWDYEERREVKTLYGHTNVVSSVAISPDGKYIASGSWDGPIKLWQMSNGRLVKNLNYDYRIESLRFSPDGNHGFSEILLVKIPNPSILKEG